jgi:hypothetical protein
MRVRRDTQGHCGLIPLFCRAWSQVQVGPEPLLGFLHLGVPPCRALRTSGEFVGGDGTLIAVCKTINQVMMAQAGFSHGKIYADMSGPMDTVSWEFEAESLDQFFRLERGFFVNPDAATQQLIAAMNGGAVEGRRENYEVIV